MNEHSPFDYDSDEYEKRVTFRVYGVHHSETFYEEINLYLELLRREPVPVEQMYEVQQTPFKITEKVEDEKQSWDICLFYRNMEYDYLTEDLKAGDTILLNFAVGMFGEDVVEDPHIYDPNYGSRDETNRCPNCGTGLPRNSVVDGDGSEYCSVWCLNEVKSGG